MRSPTVMDMLAQASVWWAGRLYARGLVVSETDASRLVWYPRSVPVPQGMLRLLVHREVDKAPVLEYLTSHAKAHWGRDLKKVGDWTAIKLGKRGFLDGQVEVCTRYAVTLTLDELPLLGGLAPTL
jgi:hypothetical protein